jgi:hypothetical protein
LFFFIYSEVVCRRELFHRGIKFSENAANSIIIITFAPSNAFKALLVEEILRGPKVPSFIEIPYYDYAGTGC